ncbi:hypothetical protein V5799_014182 [Amblyomma americanum]|uniref:Uncharacterized protein n=1 Tax=Amblyomma americanum TaxID=6943 RepID=A0AAQ4E3T1_AMBAM
MVINSLLAMTRLSTSAAGGDTSLEIRPADMMGLCLTARPGHDAGSLSSFKEFLRNETNFFGTEDGPATYTHLLEALVVLSTKWLVPLWFRLEVIKGIVVIHPEPLVLLWRRLHAGLNETYPAYVDRFIEVVYDGGRDSSGALAGYLKFLRQNSGSVQASVFEILSMAQGTVTPMPVAGKLDDLGAFTPKFTGDAWAAAVSKAYGSGLEGINETFPVNVSSRELLHSINRLVNSMSALELVYHTIWWLVQQIGSLTSNALFAATGAAFGERGNISQALLCSIQVRRSGKQRRTLLQLISC